MKVGFTTAENGLGKKKALCFFHCIFIFSLNCYTFYLLFLKLFSWWPILRKPYVYLAFRKGLLNRSGNRAALNCLLHTLGRDFQLKFNFAESTCTQQTAGCERQRSTVAAPAAVGHSKLCRPRVPDWIGVWGILNTYISLRDLRFVFCFSGDRLVSEEQWALTERTNATGVWRMDDLTLLSLLQHP